MVPHRAAAVPSTPSQDGWGFTESEEIVPGRHVVRLLGGGHRYEAYLAFDEHLYALVVAKILRPELVADSNALEGLAEEARIVQSLGHPVVLRCFGVELAGRHPHVVLEFLEGPRLSTLLRKHGPLALEQLLPLGLQLCSALHYLAYRRVVHLDIKPRNTIMGAPPRLVDFSVATSVEEAGRITAPVGTDAYMAPEQCAPDSLGPIGPPADIWGLGVTMYEALTRNLPFPRPDASTARSVADRFPQIRVPPEPLPDDVPAPLARLVRSCLERRPEDRPRPAEVASALEPLVARLPRPRLVAWRPR
jgi:serine/threonine protein kinase